jgi:hypothetical protein
MTNTYTIYTTYALISTGNTTVYNSAIHCNYIQSMQVTTDNISIQQIPINFSSKNDFKFLSTTLGTGFTAHRIYAIFQVILNTGNTIPPPVSSNWKYLDVTNQIIGYTGSGFLTPTQLLSVVFYVPVGIYSTYPSYNLNYLQYPSATQTNQLSFGYETYFFGNVISQIKADVYTTELPINLLLNQFNSTTNSSWDGVSTIYITEVGLYDNNHNLVAIGKLNDPVAKDNTISRTILFELDF